MFAPERTLEQTIISAICPSKWDVLSEKSDPMVNPKAVFVPGLTVAEAVLELMKVLDAAPLKIAEKIAAVVFGATVESAKADPA